MKSVREHGHAIRITGIVRVQSNRITVDIFLNVHGEMMDALG
jgi:nitrate/nitrite-specific signal transduction histidine kinase